MSSSSGGPSQSLVPRDRGKHARLDLTEIGAHEDVAGLGDDRPAHFGGHVVKATRRGHPSRRAVGPCPHPAQPAVGTEMLVEPGVAVGRGDALRLSPDKEGFDQRVRVPKRPQPPGPGVGHLDADAAEQ